MPANFPRRTASSRAVSRATALLTGTVLAAVPIAAGVASAATPTATRAPSATTAAATPASTPATSPVAKPVESTVRTIPLTIGGAQQRVASAAATALLADSGQHPTAPFSLVGVSWRRGTAADVAFEVRTRSAGRWSGWSTVKATDLAPDGGRADDRAATRSTTDRSTTDPLWVGRSDGVQVRLTSAARRPLDVRIELVDPGTSPSDAAVAATPAAGVAATRTSGSSLLAVARRAPGVAPAIVSRAAWGADESLRRFNPGCSQPDYGTTVKMGFVHHTDGTNSYGPADSAAIVRSIYAYHVKSNHWCDVGYNFLVDRFGRIFEGRFGGTSLPVIGAHTGGFNDGSFAASMIGNFTSVAPPAATLNAMADLYAWKLGSYYRNPLGKTVLTAAVFAGSRYPAGTKVTFNTISGHRDADFTTCPGNAAYAALPTLRSMVAARLPQSPIGTRWAQLGGSASALGEPTSSERTVAGGLFAQFQRGSINWSPATGARMLGASLTATYVSTGGPSGALGFQTTRDDTATADGRGRWARFQHGFIFSSPTTGTHETHGALADRYAALGYERGVLGYPVGDVTIRADRTGASSRFQNGYIFSKPSFGTHEVYGPILTRWQALGFETGPLGYPIGNPSQTAAGTGRYQHFANGSVFWSAGTGAHEVRGAIKTRYGALAAERGALGFPTTDERTVAPGVVQTDFQHGSISWTLATGVTTVTMTPAPVPPAGP